MANSDEVLAMCAATQADVRNICNTLDGMKQYMAKQIDQHTEMRSEIAVIKRVQTDIQGDVDKYQKNCEDDRKSIDKRVGNVENFQTRQISAGGAAGAVVSFIITVSGVIYEALRRGG